MRSAFLSTAGLLASVTLPVCVLLATVAEPLIRLVYGSVWAPAAAVLPWLALLGALRILFELVYDYFVVLANTRVVFTVQVVWLVALVPALYAAAKHVGFGTVGAGAIGAAQFLVAALVVLPIYLYELNKVGIPPGALWRRMAVPLLGAVAVAGVVVLTDRVISVDILALVVAGVVGAVAIGLLGYRMRGVLRTLRAVEATD
jgi:PST family polysaccharide transporter